ncbi:type II toxin-antitoxin system RelE family toxin [Kyrpidia spormannii]|uniref:Addiction module toxin, RelE/StbE family n=2 Tax=Kyrpidia spormannii TaxID=2055160 RepID=A0ACA8Z4W9_9BACL|nr:type II toxin-antitoxin system RelE/ParE family toxin [Kyrpidia spormannii]CAB3389427.1 Addiction module toxin, RelE/StbE family [Kyrpidia spormannii]CAB3390138.1 Addiction module toxin, RelE/StbE family [Kyrpidia spormannii]
MKLILSRVTRDFLETLPSKQFRQVVTAIFHLLTEPFPHNAKQLKGYPYYRVNIGEYRIVYEVERDEVRVILVGKRNDGEVYKHLRRMLD